MKKDIKYKVLNMVAALLAAAVIICVAVSVTVLARPLYYFDIENLHIPETSGYSAKICKLNYDVLIDYNLIGVEEELVFPTFPMSDSGRIHFEEVKEIFTAMQWISILGIIAAIIAIFYYKRQGADKHNTMWLRFTWIVIMFVTAAVVLSMALDWQWTFETMHGILFDNDYWLFSSQTDPVIKILPDGFFLHCGIMIVVIALIQIIILELIYRRLNK